MRNIIRIIQAGLVSSGLLLSGTALADHAKTNKEKATDAKEDVKRDAKDAKEDAKHKGNKVKAKADHEADEARDDAKDTGDEVKEDLKEAMINAKVRMALLKGLTGADGMRVKVTVKGQTVYLAGEVAERANEKMATEAAKSVEDVKDVKSSIKLNPKTAKEANTDSKVKDSVLASEAKMRLLQEVGDNAVKLKVTAAATTNRMWM